MKKSSYILVISLFSAILMSCSGETKEDKASTEVPKDQEIKLEDVDDQIKTDQEKYEEKKRELGIE